MRVLINAISIVEGGGLVVLKNLLQAMIDLAPHVKWYVTATPKTLAQLPQSDAIFPLEYSWINKSPLHLVYWYEITLPKLLKNLKIDICFSQTNFLPRRKLSCHSMLLVQHAGYFSDKFKQYHFKWNKKLRHVLLWQQKQRWLYQSIRNATLVTVQTNTLAEKIFQQVKGSSKAHVIPHGAGLLIETDNILKAYPEKNPWRIGYITKFGVQKDFVTAFNAISLLKKAGFLVKLILTLDEKTAEFPAIKQQIVQADIENEIENHGEVINKNEIKTLYQSLDIFIFPSFCESFGFTLIEAMVSGLPIVIADTASNREVTGSAGNVFLTENAEDLADKISLLMLHPNLYTEAAEKSLAQAKQFSWQNAAKKMLTVMNNLTGEIV